MLCAKTLSEAFTSWRMLTEPNCNPHAPPLPPQPPLLCCRLHVCLTECAQSLT